MLKALTVLKKMLKAHSKSLSLPSIIVVTIYIQQCLLAYLTTSVFSDKTFLKSEQTGQEIFPADYEEAPRSSRHEPAIYARSNRAMEDLHDRSRGILHRFIGLNCETSRNSLSFILNTAQVV